jgi:hypothetical protein
VIDASEPLSNSRQECFCQLVAGGKSFTEAYRLAGYAEKDADVNGPRLMGNDGVAARVGFLKGQQAEAAKVDRDWLRQWCERILQAKPNEASDDSDISETTMTKAGPYTALCSKMAAFDRLVRLCGFNAPEQVEHRLADDLVEQIRSLTHAR